MKPPSHGNPFFFLGDPKAFVYVSIYLLLVVPLQVVLFLKAWPAEPRADEKSVAMGRRSSKKVESTHTSRTT